MDKVIVVKLGGATLGSHDTAIEDIVELQQQGKSLIIVHGGAKVVTEWLSRQGTSTKFVRGERVTDETALEMVTAVLGGLVNKEIVAAINGLGGQAVGISGIDGTLIQSKIRNKEMGYVGDIVKVNTALLEALLQAGYVPIISPLGLHSFDKPDDAPPMLNVNGDTVAGEIAAATGAERLIFLTDVAGICDQSGNLLPQLSPGEAEALLASGVASGGMIPKIKACLRALSNTSTTCIIDGRQPHALLKEIEGKGGGTTIFREGRMKFWALKTKEDLGNRRDFEDHWDNFNANKRIAIGWERIDAAPDRVSLRDIAAAIQKAYRSSDKAAIIQAGIIKKFVNISEGDKVLLCGGYAPNQTAKKVHLYGVATVTGPFEDRDSESWRWRFRRKAQIKPFGQNGKDVPKKFLVQRLKRGSLLQTIHEISKEGFERVVKDLDVN